MSFSVDRYLQRLGMLKAGPTAESLKKLHHSHLMQIPIENLSMHYGKQSLFDIDEIFDNVIVKSHRGGFSFELNLLFRELLSSLGFEVSLLSAEMGKRTSASKPMEHMLLQVNLPEESYLADVGLIDGYRSPISLNSNQSQLDFTRFYKIKNEETHLILQRSTDMVSFSDIYRVDVSEKKKIEFLDMNDFHHQDARSFWQERKRAFKSTVNGMVYLTDRSLKIINKDKTENHVIHSENEFLSKLEQHFHIAWNQLGQ